MGRDALTLELVFREEPVVHIAAMRAAPGEKDLMGALPNFLGRRRLDTDWFCGNGCFA